MSGRFAGSVFAGVPLGLERGTAYLAFRDRLRLDTVARDACAELKRQLVVTSAGDRPAYVDAKSAHVAAVVAQPKR